MVTVFRCPYIIYNIALVCNISSALKLEDVCLSYSACHRLPLQMCLKQGTKCTRAGYLTIVNETRGGRSVATILAQSCGVLLLLNKQFVILRVILGLLASD